MPKSDEAPLSLKAGTFISSLACASLMAYCISKNQSKALNKKINIFNVKYTEKDMLKVAFSALAGGTLTGIIFDDKKYVKPKLQEAMHQAIANIACPILLILGLNKAYDKVAKNIKLPQFKETSSVKKALNTTINVLPNLLVTGVGLIAGVFAGTAVSNFINDKITDNFNKRKVKPLDFIYHPDDIAAALVLADKQGHIQKIVGRIIPPVFACHGFEAGSKRSNL
ncbi:MAG: hypothetical protein MJ180_04045 [Candidatus Gastranaerophilales bacterium]|nr:hypothetical protein [Candidatus Gastranaerophilales bacterium]